MTKTTRSFGEMMTKSEIPLWYCVKTMFNNLTGKMESEIVKDEDTGITIAIPSEKKPLDGVFETIAGTIYYTYHGSYEDAANQMAAARI